MCLRWEFPLWYPATELDALALQGKLQSTDHARHTWSIEEFIEKCVKPFDPCTQKKAIYEAGQLDIPERKAKGLIELALTDGRLLKDDNLASGHIVAVRDGVPAGKAQVIAARLANDKSASPQSLATEFGVSERYVRQVRQACDGNPPDGIMTHEEAL